VRKYRIVAFVLVGCIIGFGAGYFVSDQEHSRLHERALYDIERLSWDFHRAHESKASVEAQAAYILYLSRARRDGVISDRGHLVHMSIAGVRLCIAYERLGKPELAKEMCKIASEDLSLWNKNLAFSEFRAIVDRESFTVDDVLKK